MAAWLAQHLVLALLTGSGAIALALVLLLRWQDPVARYRVLVAFLGVLFLLLPVQLLTGRLLPASTPPTPPAPEPPVIEFNSHPTELSQFRAETSPAVAALAPRVSSPRIPAITALALARIWAAGAGVLVLLLLVRVARTRLFVRRCRPVMDDATLALWSSLRRDLRLPTRWRLLESDRLRTPACWGFARPAIVLPVVAQRPEDPERLALVLRHEVVHLRRHDAVVALAGELLCALQWCNPLVWLFVHVLGRYQELSCDALVVGATGKHRSYALTLLEFCRPLSPNPRRSPWPARTLLVGLAWRAPIRRRLHMLDHLQRSASLAGPTRRATPPLLAAAFLAALGAGAAVACTLGPGPLPAAQPAGADKGAKGAARPEAEVSLRLGQDGLDVEKIAAKSLKSVAVQAGGGRRDGGHLLEMRFLLDGRGHLTTGVSATGTAVEQETFLSGEKVTVKGDTLTAAELRVNLPEGSMLRAEITGREIDFEKAEGRVRLTIRDGEVRIIDEGKVMRVRLRPAGAPGGALQLDMEPAGGEVTMVASRTPGDARGQVEATIDIKTGVPEGEKEPPPGAVRFYLQGADDQENGRLRVKMQWTHDMSKAGKSEAVRKGEGYVK